MLSLEATFVHSLLESLKIWLPCSRALQVFPWPHWLPHFPLSGILLFLSGLLFSGAKHHLGALSQGPKSHHHAGTEGSTSESPARLPPCRSFLHMQLPAQPAPWLVDRPPQLHTSRTNPWGAPTPCKLLQASTSQSMAPSFRKGQNIRGFLSSFLIAQHGTHACSVAPLSPFETAGTVARQTPPSMGCPRHEDWSGLPFPPPGDAPDLGIKPASPALAGRFFTTEPPGKPTEPTPYIHLLDRYSIYFLSLFPLLVWATNLSVLHHSNSSWFFLLLWPPYHQPSAHAPQGFLLE